MSPSWLPDLEYKEVFLNNFPNPLVCTLHENVTLQNEPSLSQHFIREELKSPGWCGLVDWMPACEPEGRQFESQSGHLPGWWARSPVGGGVFKRQPHIDVFFPLCLPPFSSL